MDRRLWLSSHGNASSQIQNTNLPLDAFPGKESYGTEEFVDVEQVTGTRNARTFSHTGDNYFIDGSNNNSNMSRGWHRTERGNAFRQQMKNNTEALSSNDDVFGNHTRGTEHKVPSDDTRVEQEDLEAPYMDELVPEVK